MALECNDSLWFLRESLSALVVEDDPEVGEAIVGHLEVSGLVKAGMVTTDVQALEAIRSPRQINACVLDLGLPSASRGFRVLEALGGQVPAVVVTGRQSAAEGCRCRALGAVTVLDKPLLDMRGLSRMVATHAARNRLGAICSGYPYLACCLDVLFEAGPASVGMWCAQLGTDESYMRRQWREVGASPRRMLYLYWAYMHAVGGMPRRHVLPRNRVAQYVTTHTEPYRRLLARQASPCPEVFCATG